MLLRGLPSSGRPGTVLSDDRDRRDSHKSRGLAPDCSARGHAAEPALWRLELSPDGAANGCVPPAPALRREATSAAPQEVIAEGTPVGGRSPPHPSRSHRSAHLRGRGGDEDVSSAYRRPVIRERVGPGTGSQPRPAATAASPAGRRHEGALRGRGWDLTSANSAPRRLGGAAPPATALGERRRRRSPPRPRARRSARVGRTSRSDEGGAWDLNASSHNSAPVGGLASRGQALEAQGSGARRLLSPPALDERVATGSQAPGSRRRVVETARRPRNVRRAAGHERSRLVPRSFGNVSQSRSCAVRCGRRGGRGL